MYICVYIVYIVHVYMYYVTCVWYEHVCVCMYVSVWRWKVKKVKCLPNCSPFYSLCPSTEPESCLLDRTGWQVDSRSPLCLLCPLSRLQKHCTVSIFHWVLGGGQTQVFLLTPQALYQLSHLACSIISYWTGIIWLVSHTGNVNGPRSSSGTPRRQSAIRGLISSWHSQNSLPPRHRVEVS